MRAGRGARNAVIEALPRARVDFTRSLKQVLTASSLRPVFAAQHAESQDNDPGRQGKRADSLHREAGQRAGAAGCPGVGVLCTAGSEPAQPGIPPSCREESPYSRWEGARREVMSTIDGGVVLACRIALAWRSGPYTHAGGGWIHVGLTSPGEVNATSVREGARDCTPVIARRADRAGTNVLAIRGCEAMAGLPATTA
jgi:hypothetical protein